MSKETEMREIEAMAQLARLYASGELASLAAKEFPSYARRLLREYDIDALHDCGEHKAAEMLQEIERTIPRVVAGGKAEKEMSTIELFEKFSN